MSLVRFLRQRSPAVLALVALTALLSGLFNGGLIAVVNQALQLASTLEGEARAAAPGSLHTLPALALAFVALGAGKLASSTWSQLLLSRFSQQTVAQLRSDLVRSVLDVPLHELERIGPARVTACLSDDVAYVAAGLQGVPALAVNAAQIAGGALYLAWLSYKVLLGMGVVLLLGVTVHRRLLRVAFDHMRRARNEQDRLFEMFRGLTEGIKELKLHRPRRHEFEEVLVDDVTNAHCTWSIRAESHLILATAFNNLLFYGLVGGLLFVIPAVKAHAGATLSGFILTCLYLMGPVGALVGSFSYMERAVISLERIEGLRRQMEQIHVEPSAHPASRDLGAAEGKRTFRRIELRGVAHTYPSAQGDLPFTLGPIDLGFAPAEVTFLVGGNGSGKSTLARTLAGLYPPEQGEVHLDGRAVTEEQRDSYRQLFSAVFCDFYLFDRLLGIRDRATSPRISELLERLELSSKLRVEHGRFSTTALSTGQRKRLAMLVACLEDRPFYIFDEWAADQDPHFKRIFYRELLPELKARGKAVLVISHDDRYFDAADRVLHLVEGQLQEAPPRPQQGMVDEAPQRQLASPASSPPVAPVVRPRTQGVEPGTWFVQGPEGRV